ncbi:hypothetical protein G6O69_32565 [Pseudenhygromyxa sp. WMMC2535]|uniref:hypothetical protein n=1 Tax=Pseudenhygromyxa sp. WMMC2535 TaxID=2712867 RepID=UPI001551F980|nr:hypothetical protein [Pseudenhygromyxa sp. WMMC2535]NVB42602.1 hypothetical protein [Pseudenhygromyxa sp. WMMC2535]
MLHQGILDLFREDPWLAFDLLALPRPSRGRPVDRQGIAEFDAGDAHVSVRQGLPDLVLVDDESDNDNTGAVLVIEAQRRSDPEKRWRHPFYQGAMAARYRRPTWVIVVSFSRAMSALLRSWSEGPPPRVDALVLDVDSVPPVLDPNAARERPTAAVLAATLHAQVADIRATHVALRAIRHLEAPRRRRYTAILMSAILKHQRSELVQELIEERYIDEKEDEFLAIERLSGTYHLGHEEGREEGRQEGREEGRQEGREEGRIMERRAVLKDMIIALLEVRGLPPSRTDEAHIRGEDAIDTLRTWAQRARHVPSPRALFERASDPER